MGTASRVAALPLTIRAGETVSEHAAWAWKSYGSSSGLSILSPAELSEEVDIQVCWVEPSSDAEQETALNDDTLWGNWFNGSPAEQQTTPLAGNCSPYTELVLVRGIRFVADSPVASDRTFILMFQGTY